MAKPVKKPIWTNIDAMGLLNGISTWDDNYEGLRYVRLPDESALDIRRKINLLRRNPVTGTSLQDLVNGLSSELLLDSYNITTKNNFLLSRQPWPSGNVDVQDIWVSYQEPGSGDWNNVTPQVWGSGYFGTLSDGFIVWEDSYFRDAISGPLKTHNYSQLLTIFDELPDKSKIKVEYYVRRFNDSNEATYYLFTDMSMQDSNTEFIYRAPASIPSGELSSMVVAYRLDDIPPGISGFYHNTDGSSTGLMYKLRDIIDKNFRHRWSDTRDNENIWDVHKEYSKGVIPSFYDVPLVISSGEIFNIANLTAGIEHQYPSLYIRDIYINGSGNDENWYPIIEPGLFYCSGVPYYLMENPQYTYLDLSEGYDTMPSGLSRWHHTILSASGYQDDIDGFIFESYNYRVPYRELYSNEIKSKMTYENSHAISKFIHS